MTDGKITAGVEPGALKTGVSIKIVYDDAVAN